MPGIDATNLTPAAGRQIAAEVFVLAYPLLLMDAVRRVHPLASARFHRLPGGPLALTHALAEPDPRIVQTSAMIDLADGPVILHMPDTRGRYASITLRDAAGRTFQSLGSRTHDPGASDNVLVGPHWHGEIKRGFRARRAPTEAVWAVSRIVAHSLSDVAIAEELAARQCVASLLTPSPAGLPATLPTLEPPDVALSHQVAELDPIVFFHRIGVLIERLPPPLRAPLSEEIAPRIAQLGPPETWTDDLRSAMARGYADGLNLIASTAEAATRPDDAGWSLLSAVADETALERAAACHEGLGAAALEDILALECVRDESNRPLSGAERYRLSFPAGGLPPVEAHWRLAALPLDHASPSAPHRSAIGDSSDLLFNPDGSLELIVQADAPDAARPVNWLRAPRGRFRLLARLYWPRPAAFGAAWRMPRVERLGSRFARRSAAPRTTAPPPPRPSSGSRSASSPRSFR